MVIIFREIIAYLLIQIHYLSKRENEGILSVYLHNPSKSLFEKILKWLLARGYKFISIKELENNINKKQVVEKSVFISLDDGWKSNLELIPLLEKYNVPVAIFIPTDAVMGGNYWWEYAGIRGQKKYTGIDKLEGFKKLPEDIFRKKIEILKDNYNLNRSCVTLDELKKLSRHKLIALGSHTVTHPILNKCSIETQTSELTESKQILCQWLNMDIDYLAYPNGDYDENTVEIAKRCGYKLGFTINPGLIDIKNGNPFMLPRNALYEKGGYFENISKILGIWQKVFNRSMTNQV
jgi:peptidoglycan/xylan/chitin deacetylase (PgdA/CDA1 family)